MLCAALPSVAGPGVRRRPQQQLTAGLRSAPPVGRRLAFGNPLGGHGGCREAEAQPPVPASQVRKPTAVSRHVQGGPHYNAPHDENLMGQNPLSKR